MIAACVVWLLGVAMAVVLGLLVNRQVEDGEPRYSGTEIGWAAIAWPFVVLILVGIEVYDRAKRVRS